MWKLRSRVIAAMKTAFPSRDKATKELLASGFVVMRLVGAPLTDDIVALLAEESPFVDIWFHVGFHYFSPYRSSFQQVECIDPPALEPAEGRTYVQAQRSWASQETSHK